MAYIQVKILGEKIPFELTESPSYDWNGEHWRWGGEYSPFTREDIKHFIKKRRDDWESGKIQPLAKKYRPWNEYTAQEKRDFIVRDIQINTCYNFRPFIY